MDQSSGPRDVKKLPARSALEGCASGASAKLLVYIYIYILLCLFVPADSLGSSRRLVEAVRQSHANLPKPIEGNHV